jgi:predicted ATP-grasp superfamily ATP-dependent carboligase
VPIPEPAPALDDPIMLAAFGGWNDAADAATGAVEHLETVWAASPLTSMDPEDYYDFQVNRPSVALGSGELRSIEWPTTHVSVARAAQAGRDVVLVRGIEPSMRWRSFCEEIVGWCRTLGVGRVLILGAMLADTPHTRPVPVRTVAADATTAARLGVEVSRYEGPTGILSVLLTACTEIGMDAASVWAAVPHYVAQPPCPKATLALLHQVEDFSGIPIPLGELPEEARAWQLGVDELAAEDPDVAEYVQRLEEQQAATELPEASGEAIAAEFERYLRRRDT